MRGSSPASRVSSRSFFKLPTVAGVMVFSCMFAPERELSYERVSTCAERCCANGAKTIATKSGIRRRKSQTARFFEFIAVLLNVANWTWKTIERAQQGLVALAFRRALWNQAHARPKTGATKITPEFSPRPLKPGPSPGFDNLFAENARGATRKVASVAPHFPLALHIYLHT